MKAMAYHQGTFIATLVKKNHGFEVQQYHSVNHLYQTGFIGTYQMVQYNKMPS